MTGHGDGRGVEQVETLTRGGTDCGQLRQQDAGAGDRGGGQLLGRRQWLVGGQRTHPLHRLEADRTDHDEFPGDGQQQQRGFTDQLTELGFDSRGADQFLEVLQPVSALSAERDGVGLPRVQQVDERMRARLRRGAVGRTTLASGGHSVVFVDRHVLPSPRALSRVSLITSARLICLRACSASSAVRPRASAGGRGSRVGCRNPTGSGHFLGRPGVQANPYKSVIRTCSIFAPEMVTGEFYARVTTHWITRTRWRLRMFRYKRPAGRWLRSSSNNGAVQGSIVT